MTSIVLKLTARELDLLTTLAADQMFRREFLDPRFPGYKSNPADVNEGKALVGRLQLMVKRNKAERFSVPATRGRITATVMAR